MKKILLYLLISMFLFGCSNQSNEVDESGNDNSEISESNNNLTEEKESRDESIDILQIEASDYSPALEIYFKKGSGYGIQLFDSPHPEYRTFEITKEGDTVIRGVVERWSVDYEENIKNATLVDEVEKDGMIFYICEGSTTTKRPNGSYHCRVLIKEYDYWISLNTYDDVAESSFSNKDEMLEDMEETISRITDIIVH